MIKYFHIDLVIDEDLSFIDMKNMMDHTQTAYGFVNKSEKNESELNLIFDTLPKGEVSITIKHDDLLNSKPVFFPTIKLTDSFTMMNDFMKCYTIK